MIILFLHAPPIDTGNWCEKKIVKVKYLYNSRAAVRELIPPLDVSAT